MKLILAYCVLISYSLQSRSQLAGISLQARELISDHARCASIAFIFRKLQEFI